MHQKYKQKFGSRWEQQFIKDHIQKTGRECFPDGECAPAGYYLGKARFDLGDAFPEITLRLEEGVEKAKERKRLRDEAIAKAKYSRTFAGMLDAVDRGENLPPRERPHARLQYPSSNFRLHVG